MVEQSKDLNEDLNKKFSEDKLAEKYALTELRDLRKIKELVEEASKSSSNTNRITSLLNKILDKEHHEKSGEHKFERVCEKLISHLGATEKQLKQLYPDKEQELEKEVATARQQSTKLLKLLGKHGTLNKTLEHAKNDISKLHNSLHLVDEAIQADEHLVKALKKTDETIEDVKKGKGQYEGLSPFSQKKMKDLLLGKGYYGDWSHEKRKNLWNRWWRVGQVRKIKNLKANKANLQGFHLRDADLRLAHLRDADLRLANLEDADLSGAKLWDADLRGAYLRGAHLRDADLRLANLEGAILWLADLRDANLQKVTFDARTEVSKKQLLKAKNVSEKMWKIAQE